MLSAIGKSSDHLFQRRDPKRVLVEAWDEGAFRSPGLEKGFASAEAYFFQCFQAIRHKGGADYRQPLDSLMGQADQFQIAVRLQPGISAKARLKGNGVSRH